jgi:hypothetical protein
MLLSKAVEIKEHQDYVLQLVELNNQEGEPLGPSVRINPKVFSLEEIISSLQHLGSPEASEALWRLEQEKKGDFSVHIQVLREEIEGWNKLPQNAQNSLIEGQRRITGAPQADYAPDIVCLAKAVEITMSTVVFDSFRLYSKKLAQISEMLDDGLQEKFNKAHPLILYLKNNITALQLVVADLRGDRREGPRDPADDAEARELGRHMDAEVAHHRCRVPDPGDQPHLVEEEAPPRSKSTVPWRP